MLFNISGSQGQGKSTVIKTLEGRGYKVVPNKTARSILADLDLSLSDVYSSAPLTVLFQSEIIKRHNLICQEYAEKNEIYFIERSYADIFAYALAILGPHNKYSGWLNTYYDTCKQLQKTFAATFYLTGRQATVEDDGTRSINLHFSRLMDENIKYYVNDFGNRNGRYSFVINTPDNTERVSQISGLVEELSSHG